MHEVVAPAVQFEAGIGRAVFEGEELGVDGVGFRDFLQRAGAETLAHLLLEGAGEEAVDVVVAVVDEHEAAVANVLHKVQFLSAGKLHQPMPRQVAERVVEQLRAVQGHHFFLGVDGYFGVLHQRVQ